MPSATWHASPKFVVRGLEFVRASGSFGGPERCSDAAATKATATAQESDRTEGWDTGPIESGQSRVASSGTLVGTVSLACAAQIGANHKSHHTRTPLGRWRPTWRVRNRIGCCECVCLGRRACHLLGRERNRRHLTTHLKCDDSFPRVRIAILLFHLAIIISRGRTQSGSPPRDGRASLKSSYSPELHHDWSVCHHVHACFLQGIKQA